MGGRNRPKAFEIAQPSPGQFERLLLWVFDGSASHIKAPEKHRRVLKPVFDSRTDPIRVVVKYILGCV